MMREFIVEKLKVMQFDTREEMGDACTEHVTAAIRKMLESKEELHIMFAAAPSQEEVLKGLVARDDIDWRRINAYHMDEYIGLQHNAPQVFGNFLKKRLFGKVSFKSVNYINITAANPEKEAARYAAILDSVELDICLMGIGQNTHLAFNDPHDAKFDDPVSAKVVKLDMLCRSQQVDDGCFDDINQVPENAITVTVSKLISSEIIFCIVPDKLKAAAVKSMLTDPIDERCPASILRKHENATLYLDNNSSSLI